VTVGGDIGRRFIRRHPRHTSANFSGGGGGCGGGARSFPG